MKIGVISDTHARTMAGIAGDVLTVMAGVDLIVHAGDFTHMDVYRGLRSLGEVKAVHGNMDSEELKLELPAVLSFMVRGKKIGLTHGAGPPWGINDRVRRQFNDEEIIIFGHSHRACNSRHEGSLLFNPGRASESYGLITIEDEIDARIVRF